MHALSNHMKEQTMKRYRRTALGAIAALGLALAASVAGAHGGMGGGMQGGQDGMHGMGMHGGKGGMHGFMGGHGGKGGRGMGVGQQLLTPEERKAMREKMQAATTPEERQALAAANRAEMEKRAKDKGITLPERGGRMGVPGGHQH
jgi:Spy/CpxP family protein refolding chaperone